MHRIIVVAIFTFAQVKSISSECTEIGPFCDTNCNIALCAEMGAEPIVVDHCFRTTGKYCGYNDTSEQYECSSETCDNPDVLRPFKCLQVGMIPSPYECDTLYECLDIGSEPTLLCKCAAGEVIDLLTYTCVADDCSRDAVVCTHAGEYGEWINGLCYMCDEFLNAYTLRCDGKMWPPTADGKDLNCEIYIPPL